jgi:hypothetical protein
MATLALVVLIAAFLAGFVLVCMGIVGKELHQTFWSLPIDLEHPGPEHPPERHRLRLFLAGVAIMVAAAVLAAVVA